MNTTSDMFKKIKSIFIVEDPNVSTTKSESQESSNSESIQSSSTPQENVTPLSANVSDGQPDQKFVDLLLKAIETNNVEGFDYLEYKNSLKSIANVIPDESVRYKSAFEMAKTMGLTKSKLIESARHYMSVLQNEEKKFKDALENQKSKQIQGRAEQLKASEKAIEDKKKMIEQLNKEIAESTAQLDIVRKDINDAVLKIETTNAQFHASYGLVLNQIQEDITKITNNIQ